MDISRTIRELCSLIVLALTRQALLRTPRRLVKKSLSVDLPTIAKPWLPKDPSLIRFGLSGFSQKQPSKKIDQDGRNKPNHEHDHGGISRVWWPPAESRLGEHFRKFWRVITRFRGRALLSTQLA
jgi:hypothetical protein